MWRLTEFAGMPSRRSAAAKLAVRTTSTNRNTWFRSTGGLLLFLDFIHPIMPYSQVIIGRLSSWHPFATENTDGTSTRPLLFLVRSHRNDGQRRSGRCALGRRIGRPQASAGNHAVGSGQGVVLQARSESAHCNHRRAGQLRRHHHWCSHPLRAYVLADGELSRPGGRPVDERCAERQGRRSVLVDGHSTWRPGNDPLLDHYQPVAFWVAGGGPALQFPGQMKLDEITGGSPYG